MKKISSKFISLLILAAFMLTMVPVVSLGANSIPGAYQSAAAMPYTGSNVPNAAMTYYGTSYGVNKVSESKYDEQYRSEMQYSDGSLGKLPEDIVYLVRDKSTRTDNSLSQNGSIFTVTPNKTAVDIKTQDFVVEYSFALTDDNDEICVFMQLYKTYSANAAGDKSSGTNGYYIYLTKDGVKFGGNSYPFENPLKLNRWYNASIVYDIESDSTGTAKQSSYTHKFYINSELCAEHTDETTYYGPRYVRLGATSLSNSLDTTPDNWIHYDNINSYVIDDASAFAPTKPTASTLTLTSDTMTMNGDSIIVPENATLKELKDALSVSNSTDSVIRFYNSDYSSQKNNADSAMDTNIVVAALSDGTETTFSYYTADRYMYRFDGINPTPTKGNSSKTGEYSVTTETNELGGKAPADSYIKFIDDSGSPYMNFGGADSAFEFSLLLTDDCSDDGIRYESAVRISATKDDYRAFDSQFYFTKHGIYRSQSKYYLTEMPIGEWVNFALTAPTVDNKTYTLYMNGKAIYTGTDNAIASDGLRHNRFYGTSTSDGDGVYNPSIYIDNVRRVTLGTEYMPQYDIPSIPTSTTYPIDTIGKTITVADAETIIAQVKADMQVAKYSNIRVYSDGVLVEDENTAVSDGMLFVVAATNESEMERAYSYYKVRVVDGKVAYNVPKLELDATTGKVTTEIKIFNYTDLDITYKLFLATYVDNELKSINIPNTDFVAQQGTVSTANELSATIAEGETAKLFIWAADGTTPVLACSEVYREITESE